MSLEDFTLLFNYLTQAYNKEPEETQLLIWYDFMKHYDKETVKNAFIKCVDREKFFPAIATVKEIIVTETNPLVNLKADEEWEKVRQVASSIGRYREDEAMASLEPITRNIVRRIGYQDICNADEFTRNNLRSAFIKSFESEKEDIIKYEKSSNKNSAEMQMIQERNKNFLNNAVGQLVKRIDDEINN